MEIFFGRRSVVATPVVDEQLAADAVRIAARIAAYSAQNMTIAHRLNAAAKQVSATIEDERRNG